MQLIAISGKRRSGKSTLANILYEQYGYIPFHLAAPLKSLCKDHFGLSEEQVNGEAKEHPTVYRRGDTFLTSRQIMIETGQFYRSISQNYWVNQLLLKIEAFPLNSIITIPDVRFKNELESFKRKGAYLVRLERDEELTGKYINDLSETELDSYTDWDLKVPASANKDMSDLHQIASRIHVGICASR